MPVMFGLMLEDGAVGAASALAAMPSPSGPVSHASRLVEAQPRLHSTNREIPARVTQREREKGDPQVASWGDSAKSPIATARGATPSLHMSITSARRCRPDLPIHGATRVRRGEETLTT